MKRYVRASSNQLMTWLRDSGEVNDLMDSMYPEEKRLVGKIANAGVPESYFAGIVDTLDTLHIEVSASFNRFLQTFAELM